MIAMDADDGVVAWMAKSQNKYLLRRRLHVHVS